MTSTLVIGASLAGTEVARALRREGYSGEYNFDDSVTLFDTVNKQDFTAAEWCQLNMKSRAYRDGGVLAPSEQFLIGRWYEWYKELMGRD